MRSCCRVPGPVCQRCVSQFCGETGWGGDHWAWGRDAGWLCTQLTASNARPNPCTAWWERPWARVRGFTGTQSSGPPFNTILSGVRGAAFWKQAPVFSAAALRASGQGPTSPQQLALHGRRVRPGPEGKGTHLTRSPSNPWRVLRSARLHRAHPLPGGDLGAGPHMQPI